MPQPLDGIYESVVNEALEEYASDKERAITGEIAFDSSSDVFSRYLQKALMEGLRKIRDNAVGEAKKRKLKDAVASKEGLSAQISACNELLEELSKLSDSEELLNYRIGSDGKRLLSYWENPKSDAEKNVRPHSSISVSRLFTGGGKGLQLSDELNREIRTSNRVDFLVSFIKNSGINTIRSALEDFTKNGGVLRILTTTYMGVTEPYVVRYLARLPNTEVRIAYDSRNTRLHAKSYIFERENNFTTAYIGSSNLSKAAVTDGMEWNVKLTNQDAPQVIEEIKDTFEIYWNSKDFHPFDPKNDYEKLRSIVSKEKNLPLPNLIRVGISISP